MLAIKIWHGIFDFDKTSWRNASNGDYDGQEQRADSRPECKWAAHQLVPFRMDENWKLSGIIPNTCNYLLLVKTNISGLATIEKEIHRKRRLTATRWYLDKILPCYYFHYCCLRFQYDRFRVGWSHWHDQTTDQPNYEADRSTGHTFIAYSIDF